MFRPRYIKRAREQLLGARKLLRYKQDLLAPSRREAIESAITGLTVAVAERDQARVKDKAKQLERTTRELLPATWTSLRENCEMVLVVVVVVMGIRSYFFQNFKIPTGSMQPTLNGIIGHRAFVAKEGEIPIAQKPQYEKRSDGWYWKSYPAGGAKPNILRQVVEYFVLGRNYINVVAEQDEIIQQINPKNYAFFFTFSQIICQNDTYLVYAPPDTLKQDFRVFPGGRYKKGEVIARGAVDTGDQIVVDKLSYNFIRPHRGDVFVFRTDNIPDIPADPVTGEHLFYIKRLAGLPGDTLRIDPPRLYANGKVAEGFGFARVMAAKPPYHGYTSGPPNKLLSDPTRTFMVPAHSYFAMGDNSANSFDSRWWGPVPEPNIVGRGLFVCWPFTWHWGIIR